MADNPAGPEGGCGFDPSRPNPARIYDYLLGGKDNFAADREAAARLMEALPDAARVANSMLHFMPAGEADAAVAAFRERMAPGSYLVISAGHGNDRSMPVHAKVQTAYGDRTVLTSRTAAEFAAYFGDFELVRPGIVPVTEWPVDAADKPPLGPVPPAPARAGMLAGIGLKRH